MREGNSQYKRGRKQPKRKGGHIVSRAIEPQKRENNKNTKLLGRGLRTRAPQAVPKRKSSWVSTVHSRAITVNTTTNQRPVTKAQPFDPRSTNFIVWAFNIRTQRINLESFQIESLQLPSNVFKGNYQGSNLPTSIIEL